MLLGARIMDIHYPGSKDYDLDELKQRMHEKGRTEEEKTKYWFKMIDPELDLHVVNKVLDSMARFYEKVKRPQLME